MKKEEVFQLAKSIGFSHIGELNVSSLWFRQEVRDMCAANRCHSYGKCWTCPPYCGTLEESAKKAAAFQRGIIVQTTGSMEDDFDAECIEETGDLQQKNFTKFVAEMRKAFPDCLPMGTGRCTICKVCSCPGNPCGFPDLAFTSMEAYGLVVSDICKDSGLPYYYGKLTITYTACILY